MNKETFDKFFSKYQKEKRTVSHLLQDAKILNPDLEDSIVNAVNLSSNLSAMWQSQPMAVVEGIQRLIFPDGIFYDKRSNSFHIPKVNPIFKKVLT